MNGADLTGRANDLGGIEPGTLVDIIAVESDPLADITVMEKVVLVIEVLGQQHSSRRFMT